LASALTSLVKVSASFAKVAEEAAHNRCKAALACVPAALAATSSTSKHLVADDPPSAVTSTATDAAASAQDAAKLLGWIPTMTTDALIPIVKAVLSTTDRLSSSTHSSSSSQAKRSTAFLAVLLARCLVQLADAVEAVGPELLFDCVEAVIEVTPWQAWRLTVLGAVGPLLAAVMHMAPPAAALSAAGPMQAAAAAAAAEAEPSAGEATEGIAVHRSGVCQSVCCKFGSSNSSSNSKGPSIDSSSSRDSQQAKWGHLLRLQQYSPQWAAAAAAFSTKWHNIYWQSMSNWKATGSSLTEERIDQLYADALGLCKVLIAAAPLTVVCNNPTGRSE
jgi:hypothetical protein